MKGICLGRSPPAAPGTTNVVKGYAVRLADFIESNLAHILSEWESFAATLLPAAASMASLALRDHAEAILQAIASDLRGEQSAQDQRAKSHGQRDAARDAAPATAAQVHGALRASAGFSIEQLVAEYRALRASVLYLYAEAADAGSHTLVDVGRFNEAMDQAIGESIRVFSEHLERWRNLFLGVLQHDLRGPLQAVLATSNLLVELPPGQERERAIGRLKRSGGRMKELLDELLDYNRVTLNLGLAIRRATCDLAAACLEEIELRRSAHPGHVIAWSASGPTEGPWDASRVQQALGNLISNAAKHGAPGGPISVELRGDTDGVLLVVRNEGVAIAPEMATSMFDPLRRSPDADGGDSTHLGLGLFIVRQIARAHGGDVTVESDAASTRFAMRLRRAAQSAS